MRFHRKIFLAMAVTIVGISIVFITLTHLVVKEAIEAGIHEAREKEVASLTAIIAGYYASHHSWDGIERVDLLRDIGREEAGILITNNGGQTVASQSHGDVMLGLITHLGVKHSIVLNGESIGRLYYYDPDVASFNKIMIGIPISVIFVLIGSGILLILISLFIAYQLSRWLSSPLRALLPSIERLGKGELGVQAHVKVKDEYGEIADAFNRMSTQLEQAEEVRRNLTADVAHELRTPLTIIGGNLDHLQQQGQPVSPETLLPIQDELIRLNQLVEDLRTLSLAEAGKLNLNRTEVDLAELSRRIFRAIEPLAEEKEISLRLEVNTDRTTLPADADRIKQILMNLLANALRHTPRHGTVTIRIRQDSGSYLAIMVQDTGTGISPEHLPHLFDRFYRTDEARSRDQGGTGLGLAIAKQFVLSHEGTIEAESQPNKGTTFIVKLPYLERVFENVQR